MEQALSQSDNPAQRSAQNQESIKVRTYTIPAGSRLDSAYGVPALAGLGSAAPHLATAPIRDRIDALGSRIEKRLDRLDTTVARLDERTKA